MKKILFTFLFFGVAAGLFSCRKDNKDVSIKTFDEQQIQDYIQANGLTGFKRDLSNGDTTGIYYQLLTQGTGKLLDYPDKVAMVFTMRTLDGKYLATDTIVNHVYNFVGHIDLIHNNVPKGVQLAIVNILKNRGSRARVLIPSRLGYGANGSGTGSSTSVTRVAGNQSLDVYINLINDEETSAIDPVTGKKVTGLDIYDDMVINNYIKNNNLTGYTKTPSGLWYKVTQPGSGSTISKFDVVDIQYSGFRLDGLLTADNANYTDGSGTPIDLSNDSRRGIVEGLQLVQPGAKISLIMPSRLLYGYDSPDSQTTQTIPVFNCGRYDINVISIE